MGNLNPKANFVRVFMRVICQHAHENESEASQRISVCPLNSSWRKSNRFFNLNAWMNVCFQMPDLHADVVLSEDNLGCIEEEVSSFRNSLNSLFGLAKIVDKSCHISSLILLSNMLWSLRWSSAINYSRNIIWFSHDWRVTEQSSVNDVMLVIDA